MNRKIGMTASVINIMAVVGFALSMLIGSNFGSYLTSIWIAFGFLAMICAFCLLAKPEVKLAGYLSMMFASMYATIILLVYFAQCTTVHRGNLSEQAAGILDFQTFGLFFNYDLLGYALMALSTFFAGLTIEVTVRSDRWLKWLLLIHGIFFIPCFLMPMLGVFSPNNTDAAWVGTAVLEFWCAYFIPVGILSFRFFRRCSNNIDFYYEKRYI